MTKESISLTLRKLRERQKLSVKEVQEKLLLFNIDVSIKTIYGWESGKRLPDADTFLTLCDIYKSEDILSDFGYKRTTLEQEKIAYIEDSRSEYMTVNAAHELPNASTEDKKHDDDIMDDDNF